MTRATPGCPANQSASAAALADAVRIRSGSVARPRSASQQSNGLEARPQMLATWLTCGSRSPRPQTTPSVTSLWPPIILVRLSMTKIGPEFQRPDQHRRRKGVVHHQQATAPAWPVPPAPPDRPTAAADSTGSPRTAALAGCSGAPAEPRRDRWRPRKSSARRSGTVPGRGTGVVRP